MKELRILALYAAMTSRQALIDEMCTHLKDDTLEMWCMLLLLKSIVGDDIVKAMNMSPESMMMISSLS